MKRINSLLSAGVTLTSSGTAVAAPIPLDSAGYFPRFVRVVATGAGCFVKVGDIGVTAVSGDCMIQPLDGTVLNVRGCKAISAISVSGTSSVTVVPLEAGSWNYDQRTLDYNFTTLSAVPSTVTFTRGSSATYFGSDGLLKVQGYNLLLQSVLPAGTAGTVGSGAVAPTSWVFISTGGQVSFPAVGQIRTSNAAFAERPAIGQTVSFSANTTYTISATVIANTSGTSAVSNVIIVAHSIPGATLAYYKNGVLGDTTFVAGDRISCVLTVAGTAGSGQVRVGVNSNGTSNISDVTLGNIQCEPGTTATQYSPTTTAANSAPRLDYDPVTLLPRGLLVEEQRVNLLLHSRDMTQAAWTSTSVDVTPLRNQVGIDGVANSACLMTEGSAGTSQSTQNVTGLTAGATVTHSRIIKRGNQDIFRFITASPGGNGGTCWFNFATGLMTNISNVGTGVAGAATATNLGGGWYRLALTATIGGADTSCNSILVSASALGVSTRVSGATYIVDCAQVEAGSFATSPIITGSASATRSADSASMTGTNFSSWFNASAGTFVVEFDSAEPTASQAGVFTAWDGTTANRISVRMSGTGSLANASVVTASVPQLDQYPSVTVGSTAKIAVAYASTGFAVSANGAAALTSGAGTPPTGVNALALGSYTGPGALNGHIRRLQFYPVALPSATLQTLTA